MPAREILHLPNSWKDPKQRRALTVLHQNIDAKDCFDIELVYRLRQKESLGSVKQKIVRKIQQNESALCFEDLVRETLEEVSSKAV